MKLRILGNSIRLRLTQTEVGELARVGRVSEVTYFGLDNFLEYELLMTSGSDLIVNFNSGKISVGLPKVIGKPWANGAEISLQQDVRIDKDTNLSVLIEKDFKCKTERAGEDETDMFPNPDC